ncbi:MAG: hypothetical protein G01um101448_804 [Parcubacteria group bacterium Gr01-1014_48]|nr:MAG: hypothetical protein Greene041614_349 [Parcubacteria group bacterium Greene0416_14]TSC73352.1 MAG: hypothetical protein G01um101448_804 [Parcubacteria group bacterium Gr01-1014_48]TSD01317.1 MAG: hypothetical protein Greene101415_331 [Parcubacteria group bacterium Greene1014_15]TSD08004.1 MAG: hypothetical protein Greene07144_492 [Parcubacteria group bacterium Greene0714_4]
MQMEDLTKTQIVLLTLLVSFVTSLATGIVTVTLMDQAPTEVTKVFSRVIRPIEKAVSTVEVKAPPVVPKETTVIVKEEDLITESLAKNAKMLVRLYEVVEEAKNYVGLAVIIDSDGTVVTDSALINSEYTYKGVLFDGSEKLLSLVRYDPKDKTALLQFARVAEDILASQSGKISFPSVRFADAAAFKIGQTVLVLGGDSRDEAGIGILSSMQYRDSSTLVDGAAGVATVLEQKAGKQHPVLAGLGTSIRTDGATGGPLLNIFGDLMAVTVIGATNNPAYVPVNAIVSQLKVFHDEGVAVRRNIITEIPKDEAVAVPSGQ